MNVISSLARWLVVVCICVGVQPVFAQDMQEDYSEEEVYAGDEGHTAEENHGGETGLTLSEEEKQLIYEDCVAIAEEEEDYATSLRECLEDLAPGENFAM